MSLSPYSSSVFGPANQQWALNSGYGPVSVNYANQLAQSTLNNTYNSDLLSQTQSMLSSVNQQASSLQNNYWQNWKPSSSSSSSSSSSGSSGSSGVDIANSIFGGIGTLSNMGLGIAGAVESWKNSKQMRELMKRQMDLAQEQIDSSRQARKERASELARLNRVRSNTSTQFNTSAQVSRSY
jgi:hypothetical protein